MYIHIHYSCTRLLNHTLRSHSHILRTHPHTYHYASTRIRINKHKTPSSNENARILSLMHIRRDYRSTENKYVDAHLHVSQTDRGNVPKRTHKLFYPENNDLATQIPEISHSVTFIQHYTINGRLTPESPSPSWTGVGHTQPTTPQGIGVIISGDSLPVATFPVWIAPGEAITMSSDTSMDLL